MYCLTMGGAHTALEHVGLLLDCAQVCATSADFMLRGSSLHSQVCGICATVCEPCSDDCDRLAGDDELMRRCAQTCRECAASCRQMAAMAA